MKNFGEIIKYIRTSKNMSYIELSKISGISVRQIQRIETSDIVEGKIYTLECLSNALGVNLIEYAIVFSEFRDFKEFQDYSKLRHLIEDKDISEMKLFTASFNYHEIRKNKLTAFSQLLLYSRAIEIVDYNKDYKLGIKYCYKALNLRKSQFRIDKINKYLTNDICYAIVAQIESYSFFLENHELSLSISSELNKIIEIRYYNDELPVTFVPYIIFRIYIISLNNQADSLFCQNRFEESLVLCHKAIKILNRRRSLYGLQYIYWLLTENYYKINNLNDAKQYLKIAVSFCISQEDLDYAKKIKDKVEDTYPLLQDELILRMV